MCWIATSLLINLCSLDFVSQMTPFDSSSIKDMLPKLDDGHRIKFPTGWDFEAVLSHITNCDLTTTRTGTFIISFKCSLLKLGFVLAQRMLV